MLDTNGTSALQIVLGFTQPDCNYVGMTTHELDLDSDQSDQLPASQIAEDLLNVRHRLSGERFSQSLKLSRLIDICVSSSFQGICPLGDKHIINTYDETARLRFVKGVRQTKR